MKIYYSSKFAKEYKRLPKKVKIAAEKKKKYFVKIRLTRGSKLINLAEN